MTSLDDLLALLPDNDYGAIDAADLRMITTALWTRSDELEARVSALENSGAAGPSVSGIWQINPTPGATPGGMQVTADTGDITVATTWLRFAKVDTTSTDMSYWLLHAAGIYGQQQSNSQNYARAAINGTPTDGGSYVQVPVTVTAVAGDGSAGWQSATVVIATEAVAAP